MTIEKIEELKEKALRNIAEELEEVSINMEPLEELEWELSEEQMESLYKEINKIEKLKHKIKTIINDCRNTIADAIMEDFKNKEGK